MNRARVRALMISALVATLTIGTARDASAAPTCATSAPAGGGYTTTVCIVSPSGGQSITGNTTVSLTATVSAVTSVQRVVTYLDGNYLLTDYESPYSFTLGTARFVDGPHLLEAEALNRDGFVSARTSVSVAFNNGVTTPPVNTLTFTPTTGTSPAAGRPYVVAAAGDGASGEASETAVTDMLAGWNPNLFLYLGDVYEKGSYSEFTNWYGTGSTWFNRFRAITNPVVGNHEYSVPNANGYFDFWNNIPHYYSYNVAGWHIVALDSTSQFGQTAPGSPQYEWLSNDLTANAAPCTLVYFHHPRWNIGPEGEGSRMGEIWQLLASRGVDIALTGHDHDYQRWTRLDANGAADPNGIVEFVAGTGGHGTQQFVTSDSRVAAAFSITGALRLELNSNGAAFGFTTPSGITLDSGSIACSGTPVDTTPERRNSLRGASPWCVYGALTKASAGEAWLSVFDE